MQAANRLQKALRGGKGLSFGAWQMLPGTNHSRIMARCGFDWIAVDQEHGNIDGVLGAEMIAADGAMHEAVAAIAACGVSPLVRIPANESYLVKRALDAGAHGIMVPLLYTADDAKRLVNSAKFPPMGGRGFGSPFSMEKFGNISQIEYLQQANDALVIAVQIETKEALENVDAIAKVAGVDCLFVGPFDLGNNIGHPILGSTMDEELQQGIAKIHKAAVENGKSSGIYATSGEQARTFAEQGFNMISAVTDAVALPAAMTSALGAAKG